MQQADFCQPVQDVAPRFELPAIRLSFVAVNKVILFNPRSANSKHRIPNSVLQVAASIEDAIAQVGARS